jgi:predicted PurR-regulated permease PerM
MNKEKPNARVTKKELSYIEKVWHTVAIVALLVAVILVARVAFNVLLMGLAGALIATYFHGLGDIIQRKTKMRRRFAMVISIIGTFILVSALLWFMGSKIETQVNQLSAGLPHTISNVKAQMAKTSLGQKVLSGLEDDDSQKKLLTTAQDFFSTTFGVLGEIYIILFLGIFFTANPSLYKNGILLLVPKDRKELGTHVMNRISLSLKGWLKGMLLSMVMITILIAVGLSIIGIPVALILGLITGILELIPNIGSLVAMVPGVLLALTIGFNTAIIVALLYIVSQTIVANIVTPLIQKKIINLPPALTLVSQLVMGVLSGALGIILAVPLLAILIILVDELYVKKINA